uniref:KIB1-4 beta-propeller domain-containing protein n=1 Tax=Hordeum vulgare subsp. vulgare TaxID=112509 RepID=A0A8I6X183_HORVV
MAAQMIAAGDAWSNLPRDLLGEVYARVASPLGRVRFTAVCRSWRAVTSWRPPAPTIPWLIISPHEGGTAKRVLCPVDGALLRVPLPPEAIGKRLVGFHDGGWIAVAATSTIVAGGESQLAIVNLFSGAEVPLSAKQRTTPWIKKLVFSEAPTPDRRCILAAILADRLAVCSVGCGNNYKQWVFLDCLSSYDDIALCHGTKLYGLRRSDLLVHDIHITKHGDPVVGEARTLRVNQLPKCEGMGFNVSYILKHGDSKLLMAKRAWWSQENKGFFFKVFELVKIRNTRNYHSWAEVTTLDDNALFLSANCSRMVCVPAGRHGRVEANHIYYNNVNLIGDDKSICSDIELATCGNGQHLYCGEDRKFNGVDMIMSVRYYVPCRQHNNLMWLLPPDFEPSL